MIELQPCAEWHCVWRVFIAWAAVELADTATPNSRQTTIGGPSKAQGKGKFDSPRPDKKLDVHCRIWH